jgi:hypothetical protein
MASKTALTSGEGAMQIILSASTVGTLKQLRVRGVRLESDGGLRTRDQRSVVRHRGVMASPSQSFAV